MENEALTENQEVTVSQEVNENHESQEVIERHYDENNKFIENIGSDEKNQEDLIENQSENVTDGVTEVEISTHHNETQTTLKRDEKKSEIAHYKNLAATVRFLLIPSQQVATLRCFLTQTLLEMKQQFAVELKIPDEVIILMFEGKEIPDSMTLIDLDVRPNGTIQLEMHSADPINHPLKHFRPRQDYHMPDVITVRVPIDSENVRDIVVEIERITRKKPFCGGYRHKQTGIEYHNAATQTIPKPRPPSNTDRFCRDTQTMEQKHRPQQTLNETATQMTTIGTYVSNARDKLLVPGRYVTAEDHYKSIMDKVVVIQKYYRRWLAKRRVEKIRLAEKKRHEWEKEEEQRKKNDKEERIRREYERRMNPKTKEDFDLLYAALEKWRQEEIERINSTLSGAERKAALCMLLDQEAQLIATIGRHKIEADSLNRSKTISNFLEKAAAPKTWKGFDGKVIAMETPYTLRAQQLREIYESINMKYLTQDERLDALLTLKQTVKEHDCKLTQEIIQLIDREADLLMRGVHDNNLEGLRKRISALFLQYIKTPTFNPEAARLLKVPQDPTSLRQDIYFCPSCSMYLPSTEFKLSSNSKTVSRCRKCSKRTNDACVRQDHSHFEYMLKHICRDEEKFGQDSKIAFLMQENDIRYLVENIWDSQSVLSAMKDMYELVLIRWNRNEEWSPWNCILLTKEEATAHKKLGNIEQAYGKEFLHRVFHKHTLAKNYFSRLPVMAGHLRNMERDAVVITNSAVKSASAKPMSVRSMVA